jgi:hypothetical protein
LVHLDKQPSVAGVPTVVIIAAMTKPALTIARIIAAGVLAGAAIGCTESDAGPEPTIGAPETDQAPQQPELSWEEEAAAIEGIVNFREERPELLTQGHQPGPLEYEVLPPVGGDHNDVWMNCGGDVYEEQIPNEHAVHSLEHGAVWVTYRPDLPGDAVAALAERVRGTSHMFMSPFPDLDEPISLQVWGYQLKVADATDPRIDEFIRVLRVNASPEGPTAPCGGGTSATGTEPAS